MSTNANLNASVELTISTSGFVDVGQNAMIGGFISGDGMTKVIVRALGPTLSQFGVPNVLADPTLELRDANGTVIASNDNWQDTQQAEIQASGFAPAGREGIRRHHHAPSRERHRHRARQKQHR